jgi:hypothetical protein
MYSNITIEIALHYYECFGLALMCDADSKTVTAEEEAE